MIPRGIAVLGSTGSVGTTALRVLARQRETFVIRALTANANGALLRSQVADYQPTFIGMVQPSDDADPTWAIGPDCLVAAATRDDVHTVINAVVGAAGMRATIAALEAGKRVALANKETLVMAGNLVTAAARRGGGELVPVDSEHSAILQCIAGRPTQEVRRLIITASGGPFRTWDAARVQSATVTDALNHPTWSMGRKITVDSATLANKALEVIEAHHLFGIPYERIEVVVHPQSVVHSFVEFVDGSVLAQLGVPSMELPVLYALTHPDRIPDTGVPAFDPVALSPLTYEAVRHDVFPALRLGVDAGKRGGAAPAVFNAANEEAVAGFLNGILSFGDIARAIDSALAALGNMAGDTLEALVRADTAARAHVREFA